MIAALWPCFPTLADSHAHAPISSIVAVPYGTEQCAPGNIAICGLTVAMPNESLGAQVTMAVPSPYVHQPFTVQCTAAGYQIVDASSVTCALMACPVSTVSLCGAEISVPGGTSVGSRVQVPVPVSALANPSPNSSNLSVTALCMDDGNGGAAYQVSDDQGISCNLFPCQEARIRLCETMIPVQGGTPLGGVLHLTLPPPLAPEPFTVQCVGSEANPPVYQLTDVSAITCRGANTPAP